MVVGPLIGGVVGLVGALLQAEQQRKANRINKMALDETKRSNRKQEELSTSTRRDAYGNKLIYTPGVGWEYDLTDITKNILDAEQREKRLNLTTDATRNRASAERMDERSRMADDEFQNRFSEYKYSTDPGEEGYIADTTTLLLDARRRGLDEAANMTAKQLMRTGNSSRIPGIYREAGDAYADSLAQTMINARRMGKEDYHNDQSRKQGRQHQDLGFLQGIANQTKDTPVSFSSFNRDLTGRGDNALAQLIDTIRNSRDSNNAASGRYAAGVAQSAPDLSGIASALSRLDMSFGGKDDSEDAEKDRLLKLIQLSRTKPSDNWQTDLSLLQGMFG